MKRADSTPALHRGALVAAVIASGIAGSVSFGVTHCGNGPGDLLADSGPSVPDTPPIDALPPQDTGPEAPDNSDVPCILDPAHWRPLDELGPKPHSCVAFDPAAVAPAWKWQPCKDVAISGCEELVEDSTSLGIIANGSVATHDANGHARLLDFVKPIPHGYEEYVYDLTTGAPVEALQSIIGDWTDAYQFTSDGDAITILGYDFADNDPPKTRLRIGQGSASEVKKGLALQEFSGIKLSLSQEDRAGLGVYTWGRGGANDVCRLRLPGAATSLVCAHKEGQFGPQAVVRGDVYGNSTYGAEWAGWAEIYRIDASGDARTFRNGGKKHVSALCSDGITIAWLESYGDPNPLKTQPTVEVWAAPYSSDDATLDATAKKVGEFQPTPARKDVEAMPPSSCAMYDGLYVAGTGPEFSQIMRLSDGHRGIVPKPGGKRQLHQVLAFSGSKAYVLLRIADGASGYHGNLARIELGAW